MRVRQVLLASVTGLAVLGLGPAGAAAGSDDESSLTGTESRQGLSADPQTTRPALQPGDEALGDLDDPAVQTETPQGLSGEPRTRRPAVEGVPGELDEPIIQPGTRQGLGAGPDQ